MAGCGICGGKLPAKQATQRRYCGKRCRDVARNEAQKRARHAAYAAKPWVRCEVCGKDAPPAVHGRERRYCSSACSVKKHNDAKTVKRRAKRLEACEAKATALRRELGLAKPRRSPMLPRTLADIRPKPKQAKVEEFWDRADLRPPRSAADSLREYPCRSCAHGRPEPRSETGVMCALEAVGRCKPHTVAALWVAREAEA